jgi:hypothetical protein
MEMKDLFKNEGYLTVALPLTDIEPKQILVKQDDGLRRMPDKLNQLFKPGSSALPPTRRNMLVPNLTGNLAVATDFKTNVNALEVFKNWLNTSFGFNTNITSDDKIVFVFEDVLRDEITSFAELDAFLNESIVNNGTFGEALKKSDIYVITSVLKSTKFTIGVVDSGKINVGATLPTIQDIVSGDITYDRTSNNQRFTQYDARIPMIFAIQAVKVIYERSIIDSLFGKKGVFKIHAITGLIVRGDEDYKVNSMTADAPLMFS